MRLAALLAELPSDQLERLGLAHLGKDDNVTPTALCATLEGVLRSYSFVRRFVSDRFPPAFSIFEVLLESEGYSAPAGTFREAVAKHRGQIAERVASGDLVGRGSSLQLYRRVLLEARRNDLVLDASETAILGVLRRELGIRTVEHFLIEHHPDFAEFWEAETAFLQEMNSLRTCGLVFGHAGAVLLAEEVVPLLRQVLGIEMPTANRRRLYERISGGELSNVLGELELRASGSREEKCERLVASYVQPSEVLPHLSLQTLRDICRDAGASVSGSKDELVERLVGHFLHALDIKPPPDAPPPPPPEPRILGEVRFRALFTSLKGDDLTDILAGIDSSRITGAKETKVALVAAAPFSESTLLDKLTSKSLEDALARNRLRTAGSKRERVDRLVEHFRTLHESLLTDAQGTAGEPNPSGAPALSD